MLRFAGLPNAVLRVVAAVGLIIDAVVHLDIASAQPPAGSGQIDQSTLFRLEGVVAIAAALLVVLLDSLWTSVFAVLVAGSAFGAVMLSVYVDTGPIGPLPDLYEPAWYASKTTCAVAEGIALVAAVALVLVQFTSRRAGVRRSVPAA